MRPTSGGQFGPASDEVFGDWIREGRVTANAHVWRDGWPQWKLVRDVADALPFPLAATAPPPSPPPVAKFVEPAAKQPAPLRELQGEATLPASRYRASRLRKDKTQMTLAILMLVALIVLAAVLLLPPMERQLQAMVVVMAAVPMLGIYPILAQRHGHDTMAAAAQLGTTVASFFTLTAVVWGVGRFL